MGRMMGATKLKAHRPLFNSVDKKQIRIKLFSCFILAILFCSLNSIALHRYMSNLRGAEDIDDYDPTKRCVTDNNKNHFAAGNNQINMSDGGGDNTGKKKIAFVTGAAGFIGSHVARYCATNLNMEVVAVDDMSGGYQSNIPIHPSVHFFRGNVKDGDFLDSLFQMYDIDYVYHLATAYGAERISHHEQNQSDTYRSDLVGSIEVMNAAIKANVDCFVFTSSIDVYGTGQNPIVESTTPQPKEPYGISKYATELHLKAAKDMSGMDYIIFRPHNIYGPNQNIYGKYRNVIGMFMEQIFSGKPLTIFGDGYQTRAFTYIDDVAPIIAQSPLVKEARNEIFNVGVDQQPYTVNELAKEVSVAMGQTELNVQHLPPSKEEITHAASHHSKVRCFFNPPTPTSLSDGIAQMARWVNTQGKKLNPVEFVHAGDEIITTDECGPTSVAVMISGQLSRFLYKDSDGPLLKMSTDKHSTTCPPPIIDVYIALHNGTMTKPWKGIVNEAPYIKNTNTSTIENWYKLRGASRVFIKMVDDAYMNKIDADLKHYATSRSRHFKYTEDLSQSIEEHNKIRWNPYARQWYLRHLAYTMTLQRQRKYKAYLALRDDNYFVEPLDLTQFNLGKYEGNHPSPFVIVDQYCKYSGRYSDKVYVTNQPGASLLFDTSYFGFASKMGRRALWGFINMHTRDKSVSKDPFWMEDFMDDVLSAATVEEADLRRIDVRYYNDKLCVAQKYWIDGCHQHIEKELTAAGITSCQDSYIIEIVHSNIGKEIWIAKPDGAMPGKERYRVDDDHPILKRLRENWHGPDTVTTET